MQERHNAEIDAALTAGNEPPERAESKTYLTKAIIAVVGTPLLSGFLGFISTAPVGSGLFTSLFVYFPLLLFALSAPIYYTGKFAYYRFGQKLWVGGVGILFGIVLGFVCVAGSGGLLQEGRFAGLRLVAMRAEPIIRAVRAFEKDNGQAPSTLEQLVPKYLPKIPSAQWPGGNEYDLVDVMHPPSSDSPKEWGLAVSTPFGFINFDQFRYHSSGNYPKSGYGGWLQPLGKWAYVHE